MINKLKEKYPQYDPEGMQKPTTAQQKKQKESKSKETGDTEKKKLLEAKIRKQVACEEKAFRVVERLIENPISEEFLLDACQFIAPHHYEDIVEERAITKTCGYPVCSKPLTNILKQKYHISTRDNKVYDITERKNYCSNQCYKASKHLQLQISTTPLWTRKDENQQVCLLSVSRGLPGLEVVGPVENVRKEVQQLHKLDQFESKSKERSQDTSTKVKKTLQEVELKDKGRSLGIDDSFNVETKVLGSQLRDESKVKKNIQDVEPKVKEMLPYTNAEISEFCDKFSNVDLKDRNESREKKDDISLTQEDSDDDENQIKICSGGEGQEMKTKEKIISEGESRTNSVQLVTTDKDDGDTIKGDNLSSDSKAEDKLQHLMKLLDRRKQLLGQLAEIETVSSPTLKEKEIKITNLSDTLQNDDSVPCAFERSNNADSQEVIDANSSPTMFKGETTSNFKKDDQIYDKSETVQAKSKIIEEKDRKRNPNPQNAQSIIQMICLSVKTWISPKTIEFLRLKEDPDQRGVERSRSDFEAMYRALCTRVDAGEFEIEDIGDESKMEDDDSISHKPLPQYGILKEEAKEYESKVRQFYAGTLFLEPVEKDDKEKTPVYLPTVDNHDQMQIRQKIVMERLQKVISDVLSPLKLTIQDVYTDYKDIIATFRLDSKNILHKPAEWTIINLILLRMLTRRNRKIKTAFLQPSSVTYFKILLGNVGTNLHQVDMFISDMLLSDQ